MSVRSPRHRAIAALGLAAWLAAPHAGAGPYAVTAFGGVVLDNTFDEVLFQPHRIDAESAQLLGVAASARLAEPVDGLELGVEGQLVRHLGRQDHWEVNAPLTARWHRFPWDDHLASAAAFGLGLSATSETPDLERVNEGGSQPLMAYWMIEVSAGPPDGPWEVIGRLHHRSTAFGLFGEEGGANALVLGLRRRF